MPLCGFNETMVNGLRLFAEGLLVQVEKRAKESGMPVCGFNDTMNDGLRRFGEGLYAQAEKRAKLDEVSLRESFEREIAEMDIFISGLAPDSPRKQALLGVAYLAQALYRTGQGHDAPKAAFLHSLREFIQFFAEVDRIYYDELRPNSPPAEALRELLDRIK